ncbi:hypothetical protein C5167_050771 [Papaver somniferum]|uniref:Uncharacterized protein n=1 Tax=Papaver somniferum TaxID=3469 RepID=A0A4Y7KTK9_PAPSO|nr:hypothetical protein C5167_050771 [Papaver somniferum]
MGFPLLKNCKVLSIFLDAGPDVRWVGDDTGMLGVHVGQRSIELHFKFKSAASSAILTCIGDSNIVVATDEQRGQPKVHNTYGAILFLTLTRNHGNTGGVGMHLTPDHSGQAGTFMYTCVLDATKFTRETSQWSAPTRNTNDWWSDGKSGPSPAKRSQLCLPTFYFLITYSTLDMEKCFARIVLRNEVFGGECRVGEMHTKIKKGTKLLVVNA